MKCDRVVGSIPDSRGEPFYPRLCGADDAVVPVPVAIAASGRVCAACAATLIGDALLALAETRRAISETHAIVSVCVLPERREQVAAALFKLRQALTDVR